MLRIYGQERIERYKNKEKRFQAQAVDGGDEGDFMRKPLEE